MYVCSTKFTGNIDLIPNTQITHVYLLAEPLPIFNSGLAVIFRVQVFCFTHPDTYDPETYLQ